MTRRAPLVQLTCQFYNVHWKSVSLSPLSCSDGSSVHTGRTRCELNFEKLTISPITFTFDSMAREQTALVTPQRERASNSKRGRAKRMPTRRTRFHSVKGEVDSRNLKRSDELAQFCILQDKCSVLDQICCRAVLCFSVETTLIRDSNDSDLE